MSSHVPAKAVNGGARKKNPVTAVTFFLEPHLFTGVDSFNCHGDIHKVARLHDKIHPPTTKKRVHLLMKPISLQSSVLLSNLANPNADVY